MSSGVRCKISNKRSEIFDGELTESVGRFGRLPAFLYAQMWVRTSVRIVYPELNENKWIKNPRLMKSK